MSYPALFSTPGLRQFAEEVDAERQAQIAKFGDQRYPAGTLAKNREVADLARAACQQAAADGTLTWRHILAEEVWEAFAETDRAKLRAELVQVAAVCAAWVYDLDRQPAATDNDADEPYPARLGVYCDNCRTEWVGDFVVSDSVTKDQRLEIVRNHVRAELGWSVGPACDFCPACCTMTATRAP